MANHRKDNPPGTTTCPIIRIGGVVAARDPHFPRVAPMICDGQPITHVAHFGRLNKLWKAVRQARRPAKR